MQHLDTADETLALWREVLPDITPPEPQKILQWLDQYPKGIVAAGIRRAAQKAQTMKRNGTPMTAWDAMRYSASVMRNAGYYKEN